MGFVDRKDAGCRLAEALKPYKGNHPVVLALPRGGVPVAAEIARVLEAPLDLVLVRKIGVPQQPELAAGAVVDDEEPIVVRNEDVIRMADVSEADFDRIKDAEIAENRRRRALYLGDRPHPDLKDRTVIVVDDGVATGATMRAALRALRKRFPRTLVLAVPVAPTDTIERLRSEADRVECLESHMVFDAIGTFYEDFRQVDDAAVIDLLSGATSAGPPTATRP